MQEVVDAQDQLYSFLSIDQIWTISEVYSIMYGARSRHSGSKSTPPDPTGCKCSRRTARRLLALAILAVGDDFRLCNKMLRVLNSSSSDMQPWQSRQLAALSWRPPIGQEVRRGGASGIFPSCPIASILGSKWSGRHEIEDQTYQYLARQYCLHTPSHPISPAVS